MNTTTDIIDFNDENSNTTDNSTFAEILQTRVSRRDVLRTGVALAGAATVAGLPFDTPAHTVTTGQKLLGFNAVPKSRADSVLIPEGYTASIIYALGDPLTADTAAYKNDGTDMDYDKRAGDHHDGMEWFGLDANGQPSTSSTMRGLLAMNHEATTDEKLSSFFIHADGGTSTLPRPAAEVDKELAIHGLSFVEVRADGGQWRTIQNSPLNRRVTQNTPVEISGSARGHALMVTKYSPNGTKTRGTLNNCGTGSTPWGTMLSGEKTGTATSIAVRMMMPLVVIKALSP